MINTPDRLERAVLDLVQGAAGDLLDGVDKTQTDLWRKLRGLLSDLKTDSAGNIKKTAANRAILARLRRSITPLIMTDAYKNRVGKFVGNYPKLGKINDEYFAFLLDAFKPNAALFDDLRSEAAELTVNSLTEAGLEANLVNPIKSILNQNINGGASIVDLEDQLRLFILGNEERLGRLRSYTGQIARDALNQFNANYHALTADGLGIEWYFYTRGTVDDSRPFCVARNGRYFHKKEVEAWGGLSPWKGQINGTNSSTIFVYRGGYNCMHQITAVSPLVVPDDVKQRAASKGFYKLAKAAEPEPVAGGGVAPDGFQFGPDLPKEIRDKFTFNGNHPNMPDNFKDYGIDLPDQFWDLMPGKTNITKDKGGAYYRHFGNRAVNIPMGERWDASDVYKKRVFSHEFGHAWHFQNDGYINPLSVNSKFEQFYKDARKLAYKQNGGKSISDIDFPLTGIIRNEKGFLGMDPRLGITEVKHKNIYDYLISKFEGQYTKADIGDMWAATNDTIAALTNGNKGWGHTKQYWKKLKNSKYMELFAHLNENFWVGNPVFKELYPEVYEAGIKFMTELYGL